MHGTVRKIIADKLYGFITGEDNKDYFFHREDFDGNFMDLELDVRLGTYAKVQFEPSESMKGPRASNVRRL